MDRTYKNSLIIAIAIASGLTTITSNSYAYNYAPVVEAWQQPQAQDSRYRVKKGDTLYSIAWAFNEDYKDLARLNHLKPPYDLQIGQYLNMDVSSLPKEEPKPEYVAPKPRTAPKREFKKYVPPKKATTTKKHSYHRTPTYRNNVPRISNSAIRWQWPLRGPLIKSSTRWLDEKGINIKSKFGTSVRAAANGQVVYAGSGVKGYGKLIIIKHNNDILSAYALNHNILVKTGSNVRRGQIISTVGRAPSGLSFLHFEIRRNGRAINPKVYLS